MYVLARKPPCGKSVHQLLGCYVANLFTAYTAAVDTGMTTHSMSHVSSINTSHHL